jgi:hypothetical protein
MRFSERIGKKKPKIHIQIDSIDQDLNNSIWNVLTLSIFDEFPQNLYFRNSSSYELIKEIWLLFFKEPIEYIPSNTNEIKENIRRRYMKWDYLEIYDFIDFLASKSQYFDSIRFIEECNTVLERELSGYRFVKNKLTPIVNEIEINEIEKAIDSSSINSFKGASIHLNEALNKISDKYNPDYRNSIKESISAVESICVQITGKKNIELGGALKLMRGKFQIHGALESAFKSIYGYTSNGDGIRHSLSDEPNLRQEDAIFMLITCSAFVNYLISKNK